MIAGPGGSATNAAPGNNTQGAPTSEPSNFHLTDGWYVAIACIGGTLVADTKFGPIAFGILSIALIYQLNLLLQHK